MGRLDRDVVFVQQKEMLESTIGRLERCVAMMEAKVAEELDEVPELPARENRLATVVRNQARVLRLEEIKLNRDNLEVFRRDLVRALDALLGKRFEEVTSENSDIKEIRDSLATIKESLELRRDGSQIPAGAEDMGREQDPGRGQDRDDAYHGIGRKRVHGPTDEFRDAVVAIKHDHDSNADRMASMEDAVMLFDSSVHNVDKRVRTLQGKLEAADGSVGAVRKVVGRMEAVLNRVSNGVSGLEGALNQCNSDVAGVKDMLEKHVEKSENTSRLLTDMMEQRDAARAEASRLREQCNEYEEQLAVANERIKRLQAERSAPEAQEYDRKEVV